MRMILVVIAVVASGSGLAAQTPSGWSQVLALPPGTVVIVTTTNGPQLGRPLLTVDDRGVTVSEIGTPSGTTFAREDVVEIATVTIREGGFRKKYFSRGVWGALLGTLGGAVIGRQIDRARHADPSDVSGTFLGIVGGGAVGAVVAMRTGHVTTKEVTVIYRKPRRPTSQ